MLIHRNALKLPLELAFALDFGHEHFSLLAKAHFRRAPPPKKLVPTWSLEEALAVLRRKSEKPLGSEELFLKTIFLTAVASANRASELAAVERGSTVFRQSGVSLGLRTDFLFKNQGPIHHVDPWAISVLKIGLSYI